MAAPTREGSWVGVFMTGIITFITIIDFNRAIIFKLCCYACAAIMRYHFSIRKWVKYRLPGFLLSVSYFLLRRSEQRLGTQSVPLLHFFHILTVKPMIYWLLPVVNERTPLLGSDEAIKRIGMRWVGEVRWLVISSLDVVMGQLIRILLGIIKLDVFGVWDTPSMLLPP